MNTPKVWFIWYNINPKESIIWKGSFRPILQRQVSTTGKMRWSLIRNAIHFIKNTKQNIEEEDKPAMGKWKEVYTSIWELDLLEARRMTKETIHFYLDSLNIKVPGQQCWVLLGIIKGIKIKTVFLYL